MIAVGYCTCITCLALVEAERNLAKAQQAEQAVQHEIEWALAQEYVNRADLREHLGWLSVKKADCWVAIRRAKVALAAAQLEVVRRHDPKRYSKLVGYDRAKKSVDAVFRAPRGIFVGALSEDET